LWDPPTPERPLLTERSTPQREGGFSAAEMLAEMATAGVDRAVIVPPGWAPDGNGQAQRMAGEYPGRFAVMGRLDITEKGWEQQLETWLQHPHMLGARMSFSGPYFTPWLDMPALDDFWSRCERLGIPCMILLPGMAPRFTPIAERHPGLTIIVDHMARLVPPGGPERWTDLDDLLALARFPNVHVKASSAPNYSVEPYPYADIHGHLRRIFDAFGPRRMFWGSDITRLRGSYRDCVRLFTEALDFLSADDREWVMGRGLSQALKWPE
jgi:L-fuconolactonase